MKARWNLWIKQYAFWLDPAFWGSLWVSIQIMSTIVALVAGTIIIVWALEGRL